jgi:nucleotide-binding universal stress UspA family protein
VTSRGPEEAPGLRAADGGVAAILLATETIPIVAELGDPATKLSELVARHGIDLVAVGTHGRTGIMHVLLGSTAADIAEQVPCDVLIAPSRGAWTD